MIHETYRRSYILRVSNLQQAGPIQTGDYSTVLTAQCNVALPFRRIAYEETWICMRCELGLVALLDVNVSKAPPSSRVRNRGRFACPQLIWGMPSTYEYLMESGLKEKTKSFRMPDRSPAKPTNLN
jgi:hypothetical protein